MGLLLDVVDTAVARHTAETLARVGTLAAVRLIALAVARADDSHVEWMQTGVHDALAGPDGVPDVAAVCGQLAQDPEEAVCLAAAEISTWTDTRFGGVAGDGERLHGLFESVAEEVDDVEGSTVAVALTALSREGHSASKGTGPQGVPPAHVRGPAEPSPRRGPWGRGGRRRRRARPGMRRRPSA